MLPLEKQVVNLELSKKLKKLNCKQESLWWWEEPNKELLNIGEEEIKIITHILQLHIRKSVLRKYYSAFTVAELINFLKRPRLVITTTGTSSQVWDDSDTPSTNETFTDESIADSLAQMLIHLKEKGLT